MYNMSRLSKCVNIGDIVEEQLNKAGISTLEELKNVGSNEAWLKIYDFDKSACFSKLCALEGAIEGIRWHHLSDKVKKNLRDFYNQIKR